MSVRVDRILAGTDEIVVPALFPIEVAAALTRVGMAETDVMAYVDTYAWVAGREKVPLVTLDGEVLKRAASVCAVVPP